MARWRAIDTSLLMRRVEPRQTPLARAGAPQLPTRAAPRRGIILELCDPHLERAAEIRRFRADRQLHIEQLRFAGQDLQALVEQVDSALVLLHLPVLLADRESLLSITRLTRELLDEHFQSLDGVALLLVRAGEILERGPVERVSLQRS